MTTVKELITMLEKFPPEAVVVMSVDDEGNTFNPFSGDYSTGKYNVGWREFYSDHECTDPDPDECDYHHGGDEDIDAVCLWP